MDITGFAKCHTSIVLIAWRTDLKNGVPSREPEKYVTHMRDSDEFRDVGKCIDVDSTLLRLASRVSTRYVYRPRQLAVNVEFPNVTRY